ncbi:hypothetical protein J6590_072568 [Homalodisca vitripennis]|nr:hypothetical protein J6590_072568 [Homalodisca vitripennis]
MDSHRNASGWMHGYENDTELVGYVPYSERPETYIVPVVFAIIFLVGVLGNGTLVFIFARHRTMRNVPNTYIFSLALGDLLVIVSCVPFTSTLYTIESWPWGRLHRRVRVHSDRPQCREVLCNRQPHQKSHLLQAAHHHHGSTYLDHVFDTGSSCSHILQCPVCGRARQPYDLVLLALPELIRFYVRERNGLLKFLAYYAIPLCVIAGFYVLMARHLMLSTRTLPGEHNPCKSQSNQIQARKKLYQLLHQSHRSVLCEQSVSQTLQSVPVLLCEAHQRNRRKYSESSQQLDFPRHNSVMTSHYSISHSDKS